MIRIASIAALAVALTMSPSLAQAGTPDEDTCDRLTALPFDRDRPEGVKGVSDIAKKDLAAAIKACAAAAKAKDAHRRSTFQLGRAHEFARAFKEAGREYAKAAAAGSSAAMIGMGMLHANGNGVARSEAEMRAWFEKAADAGDPAGMTNLASVHGAGMGVPVDFAKARVLLAKAIDANYSEAMLQLGLMTQDGDGGPKDEAAAKALFEKAAALNNAGALYMLGEYAEAGRAGAKDTKVAMEFYRKSAELGDEDAREAYERLRCPYSLKDKSGKTAGAICLDVAK